MSATTRQSARQLLQAFVAKQEAAGTSVAVDILRVLHTEAHLLYETQAIQDLFAQDPFECYYDNEGDDDSSEKQLPPEIQSFRDSLQVTECHRVETADNYSYVQAVVQCPTTSIPTDMVIGSGSDEDNDNSDSDLASRPTKKHKGQPQKKSKDTNANSNNNFMRLHFRYERDPATATTSTCIWYSIDLSFGYGPKQNLITVRVWAEGTKPSRLPAVSVDDRDEDSGEGAVLEYDNDGEPEGGSEDKMQVDSQTDATTSKSSKNGANPKTNGKKESSSSDTADDSDNPTGKKMSDGNEDNRDIRNNEDGDNVNEKDDEEARDRYACYVDPESLELFQKAANLTNLSEATAFFTLMVFPFYQHEFDLVGFVLDSIFGNDDDDSVGDGENDDNGGGDDEGEEP